MKQSEINEQMKKACEHIMQADGQDSGQKREQMYALVCASWRLDCEEVVRPYYDRAKVEDGIDV